LVATSDELLQQLANPLANRQPTQSMLQQMVAGYGGTGSIPAVQKSEYLAQALAQMNKSADGIKSWGALGANLMAEALLQYARNKSNKELLSQIQQGQAAMAASAGRGTGIPGMDPDMTSATAAQAPAPPMDIKAGMSPIAPPPASVVAPPTERPVPPPMADAPMKPPGPGLAQPVPQTIAATPQGRDMLTRALIGEASPDPADQAATASVVLNRSKLSGQSIEDVIKAPGQFEAVDNPKRWARLAAIDPNNPAYMKAAGVANKVLSDGPTGNWDHFYAPQAQAALGRPPPAWDNGKGQMIGAQKYFAQGYGGQPPIPPGTQNAPASVAMPTMRPPGATPMPGGQMAGGQMPPQMPMQGGQMPPQAPPMAQGAMPPQGPQQGPSGVPTGLKATPQEIQYVQDRMRAPPGSILWQQGLAKVQEIQQRAITPMDPPKDYRWGPDGKPVPLLPYQDVSGPQNAFSQRGPDNQLHVTANPAYGAIPPGTALGASGIAPIQGSQPRPLTDPLERAKLGILPSDRNAYAIGPDGKVTKTADNPYGPKEIQSVHDNFWGSDETKKAMEGIAAYNGITGMISKYAPNGITNSAAMDSFLRGINPGMGAKNSTVSMVLNHIGGLGQAVREHILSKFDGNGYLTPQTLQSMVQTIQQYTQSHMGAASARAAQDAQMVKPYGYGPTDLGESLPPLGPVPPINAPGYTLPGAGQAGPAQPINPRIRRFNPETGRLE
jgi:hypothetical protein